VSFKSFEFLEAKNEKASLQLVALKNKRERLSRERQVRKRSRAPDDTTGCLTGLGMQGVLSPKPAPVYLLLAACSFM
jgi:hypothetical protein